MANTFQKIYIRHVHHRPVSSVQLGITYVLNDLHRTNWTGPIANGLIWSDKKINWKFWIESTHFCPYLGWKQNQARPKFKIKERHREWSEGEPYWRVIWDQNQQRQLRIWVRVLKREIVWPLERLKDSKGLRRSYGPFCLYIVEFFIFNKIGCRYPVNNWFLSLDLDGWNNFYLLESNNLDDYPFKFI